MRIHTTMHPDRDRLEKELISHLFWQARRKGWEVESSPESVPGNPLVTAAGKLWLLKPSRVDLYERALWPWIRRYLAVDSPADLARGTFDPFFRQTQGLFEAEQFPTLIAAESPTAQRGPSSEVLRLFRERSQAQRMRPQPVPPEKFPPEGLDESSRLYARARSQSSIEREMWLDSFLVILDSRLEAGFFLAGLEALWRTEGEAASRLLWHEGRLHSWDRYLSEVLDDELRSVARGHLLDNLAEFPATLGRPWFGFLQELLREGRPSPTLVFPDDNGGFPDPATLRMLLLEDYIRSLEGAAEFPVWAVSGDGDPDLLWVTGVDGGAVGVWFPAHAEAVLPALRLSEDPGETLVCLAEIITLTAGGEIEGDEEPDSGETWLFSLRGWLRPAPGANDLNAGAFTPGEDEAAALLLEALKGPGG